MIYLGDFALGATVRVPLNSFSYAQVPIAPSSGFAASDFAIYKNGSATEKTTTNGVTVTSPFDSRTGLHTLEIDTSNNTGDTGFWAASGEYWVVYIGAKTVDGASQAGVVIAVFSVQGRYMRGTDSANTTAPDNASVAAIKTQTDKLTFDGSNRVSSNVTAMATDVLSSDAVSAGAVTKVQSGLATLTKLLKYVQLMLRKDAAIATDNATELTEINADGGNGVGGYLSTTDSQEAIKDAIAEIDGGGGGDATLAKQNEILSRIAGGRVRVSNPVGEDETLTLYRDDDYSIAAGNAPQWSKDGWTEATWASATAVFRYQQINEAVTEAGTVTLVQSGDNMTAKLEIGSTALAAMKKDSDGGYEVQVTSADTTKKRTIGYGRLIADDRVPLSY